MDRITMPAGQYYLGDPCYCLASMWREVLDKSNYFETPFVIGKKLPIIAFETAFGDGIYFDQNGTEYSVDSGLIGLVPVSMADSAPIGVQKVKFKTSVECYIDGPRLHFGEYVIDTDPDPYEPDDHCPRCGRG
jgi:hypothetical protein